MRTHALVFAAALSLGLVLPAPAVFAQDASDRGAVRRWPTAADGGASVPTGRAAVARSAASVEAARPAERATGTFDSGRVSSRDRIAVDQGRLEQRRSPGGGGGGATVRGGGGVRGGDGGGRVAVPRGSVGGSYPGGRPGSYPGGRRAVVRPGGYPGGYYGHPYYQRYYYPYYYPYSSFYYGVGFNTWGYWGAGWGPAYGYVGYGGYPYAYPYGGYGYPYGGGYGSAGYNTGKVRLEVQPRDAEVFIDGSYAGLVDDFDGRMQGLELETGGYNVEIRKPGWETLTFDVRVTPGRTTHYKSELIPQKP